VDQSASAISAANVASSRQAGESWGWLLGVGRHEVERAMRAVGVVVLDEDAEHSLEVAPVEDEEPVETFGAGGADEALGDRIRFGRPDRCPDNLDPFTPEDGVEVTREFAVAIADQERTGVARSGKVQTSWRACWLTQAPSGLDVQPARWTRRLPSSM
jgi:hypothetical protein